MVLVQYVDNKCCLNLGTISYVPYLLVRYGMFYVQPATINEDLCDHTYTIKNIDIALVTRPAFVSRL